MSRVLMLTLAALLLAACNNNSNNIVLASLNRPAKLQFLCADLDLVSGNLYDLKQLLPTELCTSETVFAPDVEAQFLGAVTQIQTGEVAILSFTTSAIFDTNRTVPGVTALRVGEQPTGIQISGVDPTYTYISSFSPKSVQAVPTEAVITGESNLPSADTVRFDAGPTDLILHEQARVTSIEDDGDGVTGATTEVTYRYLYAAIPDLGVIAQIEIDPATGLPIPDSVIELPLPTYDCSSVTQVTPPASTPDDYNRICPQSFQGRLGRYIKTVETTTPCAEGPGVGPSPIALTLDRGLREVGVANLDDILLVADANQPVIHRFQLRDDGATLLDPIITGTPTTDIAVTPYVPASSDPNDRAATERYLYAVSATDSSVFAVDYTPGSATFGAVLPVRAGQTVRANEENVESRDRARFGFSNVRSIEVIAPFYDLEADPDNAPNGVRVPEAEICTANDGDAFALAQNARNLRGVFLAVSLSNGTMTYLDIYDLNAPCRGGEGATACTLAETSPDQYASIRRNRPRISFTPSTFIQIEGTPSLQFDSAPGQLDPATGQPANSDGPGLDFITCPDSMLNPSDSQLNAAGVAVFGSQPGGVGLICASSQIWSDLTQAWEARWAGLIPGSEGGLGLFSDTSFDGEPGNWFLAGDVPFCQVGILGRQSGPEIDSGLSIDALSTYVGDRLLIVGELPPSTRDNPRCANFVDLEEDLDQFQVWFPILRAFNDELEIGPSPNNRYTLDDVRFCFNQYTQYQIHTQAVYTVTGSVNRFIHNVVPGPNDECIFDPDRPVGPDVDTFLTARAVPGTQFINPFVSFQIAAFPPGTNPTNTSVVLLNFNISNQFTPLVLDTSTSLGSLPSSMLFSPLQDQLFFVDLRNGVRRIVFEPLSIVQTFD